MVDFFNLDMVLEGLRTSAEFLTILVSIVGAIIALKHAAFLEKANYKLTNKLRQVFLTDAAIYVVTLIMGIALFFNLKWLVIADIIIRPFVLVLNVIASIALYHHYKLIKPTLEKEKESEK